MGSRFIARRISQALITIVMIVLLNFVLFRAMPGSPERVLLHGTPRVTAVPDVRASAIWITRSAR